MCIILLSQRRAGEQRQKFVKWKHVASFGEKTNAKGRQLRLEIFSFVQASCILCLQNFHLAKLPSLRNRSCSSFSDVGVVFLSSHPLSCVFSLLKWSPVCFPCWNGLPPGALLTLLLCPTCFSSRNARFQKHVPLWPSAFGKQKYVKVRRQ